MAYRQGPTTVTTVYTTSPQVASYPVVAAPVQIQRNEITFKAANTASCKINGIIQLTIGTLCLIFGIVAICIDTYYGDEGTPFWCGFWFIIAGYCGVSVGRCRGYMAQKSLMRFLWLSSVSTMFAVTLLILMSIAVAREPYVPYVHGMEYDNYSTRVAIDSVLLTLACMELLASIYAHVIARRTSCQADRKTTVTTQPAAVGVPPVAGYPVVGGNTGYAYPPPYAASQVYPPPQGYPQPQYGFPQPQPGPVPQQYGLSQPQPDMTSSLPPSYGSATEKPTPT